MEKFIDFQWNVKRLRSYDFFIFYFYYYNFLFLLLLLLFSILFFLSYDYFILFLIFLWMRRPSGDKYSFKFNQTFLCIHMFIRFYPSFTMIGYQKSRDYKFELVWN